MSLAPQVVQHGVIPDEPDGKWNFPVRLSRKGLFLKPYNHSYKSVHDIL